MTSKKEECANMLRYVWTAKGDIERYTGFDREYMMSEFPEVLKAWDDYKTACRLVTIVINNLNTNDLK